jgi:DNA-directed RNA polymerase beta subunit
MKEKYENLKSVVKHHIDSFNWFTTEGLSSLPNSISPLELNNGKDKIKISLKKIKISKPKSSTKGKVYYPREAREAMENYSGELKATFTFENNSEPEDYEYSCGEFPIMVKSNR